MQIVVSDWVAVAIPAIVLVAFAIWKGVGIKIRARPTGLDIETPPDTKRQPKPRRRQKPDDRP